MELFLVCGNVLDRLKGKFLFQCAKWVALCWDGVDAVVLEELTGDIEVCGGGLTALDLVEESNDGGVKEPCEGSAGVH
jgi:hypothetical protein